MPDGLDEKLWIGLPITHELRKSFGSVQENIATASRGLGNVQTARSEALGQAVNVTWRSDDNGGIAGSQGRADQFAQSVEKKGIVGIKLDDVPAAFVIMPMRYGSGVRNRGRQPGRQIREIACAHIRGCAWTKALAKP
jgi:hypothetical protein